MFNCRIKNFKMSNLEVLPFLGILIVNSTFVPSSYLHVKI